MIIIELMAFLKNILNKFVTKLIWKKLKRDYCIYNPILITITGSVGKTTTMQFILEILGSQAIGKPALNTPIGLPLALYGVDLPKKINSPWQWLRVVLKIFTSQALINKKYWVMEWGVDKPGDMDIFLKQLTPDIGIITGLSGVHLENFNSVDDILTEKWKLILAAKDLVIINSDFKILTKQLEKDRQQIIAKKIILYGSVKKSKTISPDINITNFHYSLDNLISKFNVEFSKENSNIVCQSQMLSIVTATCSLPGLYLAKYLEFSLKKILIKVASFREYPGRGRVLSGQFGSLIIDSSYNSSPISVKALIDTVESIKTKRKIVYILGDNNELGSRSEEFHNKIGQYLADKHIDYLICFGVKSKGIEKGFLDKNKKVKVMHYLDTKEAAADLDKYIQKHETLLVFKGSQNGVYLEEIVLKLLEEPKDQSQLVRQNKFWKNKKVRQS